MIFLEELKEASNETRGCKVCAFLDTLIVGDQPDEADKLIRAKTSDGRNKISDDRIASIIKTYGGSVGATTVRRHRVNCPPRSADAQS